MATDFELLVQSVTDYAIYMLDPQGFVTSWNAGARRFKGYEASEIIGQHFSQFYTPEARAQDAPKTALETASREGRFEAEGWRLRKDGSRFWASVIIDPIRSPAGELLGFAKVTRDLTERRAAEHALRASDERFRLLVQSVTDYAIYMLDPQGHVSSWNAGAERFKGYTADEIMGQHFSRFYLDEDRAAGTPWKALQQASSEGRFEAEGWRLRKDGSRFWASVVIDPIRNDDGELIGYAKVTRDLTEKRSIEEQLRQSQKMEAVGQLTGGLAHDFNNLLTAISGSLEMMQTRIGQGRTGELDRYLNAAQGAAKRAAAITHRLLAFSRRQALAPEPIDAHQLVLELQELIQRTVGPGVKLSIAEPETLWAVLADPNQLENAILNLCINARDAMPDGGALAIELSNISLDEQAGRRSDLRAGDYVKVAVVDTGTGMPPEIVAKVFDPFFTTKPLGEGTGLGLSMIYGFARQSGGHVAIQSAVGKGTSVSLYLPRHGDEVIVTGRQSAVSELAAPQGRGEVILFIDDEAGIRMLVSEVLVDAGYTVIEAADGPAGLQVLASNARVDLLVTDIGLPGGMNGRQVAEAARLTRPNLKVLFVTGYADVAVLDRDGSGANLSILTKPFTVDALMERVQGFFQPR